MPHGPDLSDSGNSAARPRSFVRHVPNLLTASRFPLAVLFAWGIAQPEPWPRLMALGCAVLAILTDWADGWSARRLGFGSDFGKLFDPAADAFFFVAAYVGMAVAGIIPWWLALPFVVREAVQHAYVRPAALRLGVALGAKMIGKLKTALQSVVVVLVASVEVTRSYGDQIVASVRTDELFVLFDWIVWIGVGATAIVSVVSIAPYVTHLVRIQRAGVRA